MLPLAAGALATIGTKLAEEGLTKAVQKATSYMLQRQAGTDLISYSQPARLEPILLLDQRATYVPFIRDVIHTMSNLFTAYFLQSIALDTTISGVKVLKRLDKFNPDRDLSVATRSMLSTESYQCGLPFLGEAVGLEAYGVAMEAPKPLDDDEYDDALTRAVQNLEIKEHASDYTRDQRREGALAELRLREEVRRSIEEENRIRDRTNRTNRAMDDAAIRERVDSVYNTFDKRLTDERDKARIRKLIETEMNDPNERLKRAREEATIKRLIEGDEEEYRKAKEAEQRNAGLQRDGSHTGDTYGVDAKDVSKMVNDITNLAVGKMIEVTISENGQSAKIPVTVRMRVTGMAPQIMVETLSVGGYDGSFKSRWRQWRAGEIRFWADGVFAMDRIDAHRKAAMKDKSGYYAAVHKRDARNLISEAMTGDISVGTASSIIVMTEQTKKDLERNLNRKISDFRARQTIFESTYAMLMVVVDPEWESVVIYHRGIEMPTELTAKDVTTSAKSTGPDITEILKMFMEGKAPSRL